MKAQISKWTQDSFLKEKVQTMAHDPAMKPFLNEAVQYLKEQALSYLSSFEHIDDHDDHGYYTAVQYVELKARWIQMNLLLSYQAFTNGAGDPATLLKAGATSALLAEIEPFVEKNFLGQIQTLLAQPVFGDSESHAA